jgi:hypothetical protein
MVGLPPGEAVGTAFVFAVVLRLIAAPFYLFWRAHSFPVSLADGTKRGAQLNCIDLMMR